jgi:hypothetical protein
MKFIPNPDFPDATAAQKWDQFRIWRAAELAATDWTQFDDSPLSPADKADFLLHRQELRDAPTTYATVEELDLTYEIEYVDYKIKIKKLKP